MAKTAWVERNNKKRETVKKYAALRAELKRKKDYAALSKTAEKRQPDPRGQPLLHERTPPRLPAQVRLLAHDLPGRRIERADSRRDQGELVG